MEMQVDYSELITRFMNTTDNFNEEIAFTYLEKNNWNEEKALREYKRDNKNTTTNTLNNNISGYKERLISPHTTNTHNNRPQNNEIINKNNSFFFEFCKFFCCQKKFQNSQPEKPIQIQGMILNVNDFYALLTKKIGIAIIYSDIFQLNKMFNKVKSYDYLIEIIKNNYIIFTTTENLFNIDLFTPNKIIFINSDGSSNFTSRNIVTVQENFEFELFQSNLFNVLEKIENSSSTYNTINELKTQTNQIKDSNINQVEVKFNETKEIDYNTISNSKLLEFQKRELEELEFLENKKNEVVVPLKKSVILPEKKTNFILNDEPEESNENVSTIIFRYPHSDKRVIRRFLIDEKIQILYDFINSLNDLDFEDSEAEFELINPFPYKLFDKQASLKDEKLFPNALIQIREIN